MDEWQENTGMQYPIQVSENKKYHGLEIGLEFKNNTKTQMSVEYIAGLIVKFCNEAIKSSLGDGSYSVTVSVKLIGDVEV